MKKKGLICALALTGCVAIVGSGFSAWYFDTAALTKTKSVNTYVTDLAEGIGTLTDNNKDQTLYVVLDQATYANLKEATKGISITNVSGTISDSNLGEAVNSLGATYTISAEDVTKLVAAGKTSATFTATITISDAASTYIEFVSNYNSSSTSGKSSISGNVFTYTQEITYSTGVAHNDTFTFDTSTTSDVNAMLQYKLKPTDATKYNEMKTALSGKNILTVEYKLEVK